MVSLNDEMPSVTGDFTSIFSIVEMGRSTDVLRVWQETRKGLHYRDRREGYHQLPLPSFLPSFLPSPPTAPERLRATLCGRTKSSSGPVSGAVNVVRCIEVQWQPRAVGPRHDEWDSAVYIHSACLTHDGWRSLPSSLTHSLPH